MANVIKVKSHKFRLRLVEFRCNPDRFESSRDTTGTGI